jgi:integrase
MKMEYRIKTKYPGVYERLSATRMHKGKPDVCFDISYKHGGRKVWEKIGWTSEGYSAKLAADIRAERTRAIRHGEDLPKRKKAPALFKAVALKYLEWARENKSDKGAHDVTRFRRHLEARLGNKPLDQITSFDLERVKSELLKGKLAPATVKQSLVLVRQIYNKAVAWKLYEGMNPIRGVKLPTLNNARERFLSYEEAELLLNEFGKRSADVHDMALLSLHSGMRAGEIFNLRCHDINLQHELITILDPKNKKARKAYMTKAVKKMFQRRVADLGPDAYVFTDRQGKPYREMLDIFGIVSDELFNKGVKDRRQKVTFHSLRHTFASWLALQGESLVTIRELLGHKSFAMTQRYAHLMPDQKKTATLGIERAMTKTAKVMELDGNYREGQ